MSNNLGSVFVMILLTTIALLLILVLEIFSKRVPCMEKAGSWLKKKLLWNFILRLIMEGVLELSFCIYFNLRYGSCDFKVLGSWVNYFYAVFFAAIIVAMPFFILIFYCKNFLKLKDKEFKLKYGSVYEGLRVKHRAVIFYTAYFLTRRCIFTMVSLFLYRYPII